MNIKKINLIVYLLCAISVWEFGSVAYIHAKAVLAQYLVEQAWSESLASPPSSNSSASRNYKVRPWPWSDSWPVAKLRFPHQQLEQIVLAGATGSSLAFAPGWMKASALPGSDGISVIAAHRDTHFSVLKDLHVGHEIIVETAAGRVFYRVVDRTVVDSKTHQLAFQGPGSQLLLVTCYPFDAITNGGSLRYLVTAEKMLKSPAD